MGRVCRIKETDTRIRQIDMLRKVLSRFFEVGNQFPTSETILSIYSEPSCEKALINVSYNEGRGFCVAFNNALVCEMGGKANLDHLAYLEQSTETGNQLLWRIRT